MSSSYGGQAAGRCLIHPDNEAVGVCSNCGGFICNVCMINHQGKIFCPKCFSEILIVEPVKDESSSQRNMGIWSLVMFGIALLFTIVDMYLIPEDSSDAVFTLMGAGMFFPSLVGLITGIVGLSKKSAKSRVLCIVGVVLNVISLGFVVLMMIVGALIGI